MRSYDIVQKEQDLTMLEWGERVNSSGTAGTYLKARTGQGARAIYYKLPRYNGIEFDGHECINELVAARLMRLLEIDHLEYRSSTRALWLMAESGGSGSTAPRISASQESASCPSPHM